MEIATIALGFYVVTQGADPTIVMLAVTAVVGSWKAIEMIAVAYQMGDMTTEEIAEMKASDKSPLSVLTEGVDTDTVTADSPDPEEKAPTTEGKVYKHPLPLTRRRSDEIEPSSKKGQVEIDGEVYVLVPESETDDKS